MCYAMTLLLGVITVQCSTNATVMLVTLYFTWTSEKVTGLLLSWMEGRTNTQNTIQRESEALEMQTQ